MDLSGSWARFTELHKELLEKYIPESKPCQCHGRNNQFIDQTYLDAIKVKHRKWTKYKYCKSQENFSQFKIARNNVPSHLRIAKQNYEKDLAAKIKTDNKLFWSYVRLKSKTKPAVSKLRNTQGELTSNDQETANTLNDYFANIFVKENDQNIPPFQILNFNEPLDQIIVTRKLVGEATDKIKSSKMGKWQM